LDSNSTNFASCIFHMLLTLTTSYSRLGIFLYALLVSSSSIASRGAQLSVNRSELVFENDNNKCPDIMISSSGSEAKRERSLERGKQPVQGSLERRR
jgi:hypothetical protein